MAFCASVGEAVKQVIAVVNKRNLFICLAPSSFCAEGEGCQQVGTGPAGKVLFWFAGFGCVGEGGDSSLYKFGSSIAGRPFANAAFGCLACNFRALLKR